MNESEAELRNDLLLKIGKKRSKINLNNKKMKENMLKVKIENHHIESEIKELKTEMNNLPIGINKLSDATMSIIFYKLNIQDLIKCEQVCTKWVKIIKMLNLDSLIIVQVGPIDQARRSNRCSFTHRSFKLSTNFASIESKHSKLQPYLQRLKVLVVLKCDSIKQVNLINSMTHLEILEIDELNSVKSKLNQLITITLPNLKRLAVEDHCRLKLNTPQLCEFVLRSSTSNRFSEIAFVFPQAIKRLELSSYVPQVGTFANLEVFCWRNPSDSDVRMLNLLSLKRLDFDGNLSKNYMNFIHHILSILERKQKLNRTAVQLSLCGIIIEDRNQLNENQYESLAKLQMRNYSKLIDDRSDETNLVYSDFVDCFTNNVPADFSKKFPEIQQVTINDIVNDYVQLIDLLNGLKKLAHLVIENSKLDDAFYNHRSLVLSGIRRLRIKEDDPTTVSDYSFLMKLSNGSAFLTNLNVPFVYVSSALQRLNHFEITSMFTGKSVTIKKKSDLKFHFDLPGKKCKVFNTFESLFDHLKDENLIENLVDLNDDSSICDQPLSNEVSDGISNEISSDQQQVFEEINNNQLSSNQVKTESTESFERTSTNLDMKYSTRQSIITNLNHLNTFLNHADTISTLASEQKNLIKDVDDLLAILSNPTVKSTTSNQDSLNQTISGLILHISTEEKLKVINQLVMSKYAISNFRSVSKEMRQQLANENNQLITTLLNLSISTHIV